MSDLNSTALHQAILQAGYTVDDEIAVIEASLNTEMFQALLIGIYTVVFGGTMYIYLTRRVSNRIIVPAAVSMLYMINLATFGVQWYTEKWQLIDNGENRDTIFAALSQTNVPLQVAINVLNLTALALGDGLLIWRCFNLWNQSLRVVFIPIFLVVTEAVQSGAVYSLSLLILAVSILHDDRLRVRVITFNFWATAFVFYLAFQTSYTTRTGTGAPTTVDLRTRNDNDITHDSASEEEKAQDARTSSEIG
ncbi:hypothetical protein BDN70DRAFT_924596 [Pholiota conissans]|uniref:Uncharacterized protein n=1 Tax=Pholiota conissans TaxID=109636 RepID=A0A9P5YS15_9AGAR|nr:hypothetical protein BDN70DRAFT_924596 [Pholiota conissans]